jgi:hypothetical protein
MYDTIREQMERIADWALRIGDPRSQEYHLGIVDCLCRRTAGASISRRYQMATAQDDAYWAGCERGWEIWKKLEKVRVENDILADWNRQ